VRSFIPPTPDPAHTRTTYHTEPSAKMIGGGSRESAEVRTISALWRSNARRNSFGNTMPASVKTGAPSRWSTVVVRNSESWSSNITSSSFRIKQRVQKRMSGKTCKNVYDPTAALVSDGVTAHLSPYRNTDYMTTKDFPHDNKGRFTDR
jgi:hypothetical protein